MTANSSMNRAISARTSYEQARKQQADTHDALISAIRAYAVKHGDLSTARLLSHEADTFFRRQADAEG